MNIKLQLSHHQCLSSTSRDLKLLSHCTTTTNIQGNFLEQTLVTFDLKYYKEPTRHFNHSECGIRIP